MKDLSPYARAFEKEYPAYADARYHEIKSLVDRFGPGEDVLSVVESEDFGRFAKLLSPIIAIKNYKSQTPFPEEPEDICTVMATVITLKRCRINGDDPLSKVPGKLFGKLVDLQGFQLPTVSAVFHFCHPQFFPIVDRSVKSACRVLKKLYPGDFQDMEAPSLPSATTSANNKLAKYRSFIAFITKVLELQSKRYGGRPDYRFIDKALMVLGRGQP